MEKRYYISPRFEAMNVSLGSLMLPSSPTGGEYDPLKPSPKRLTPANPVLATDTVAVF